MGSTTTTRIFVSYISVSPYEIRFNALKKSGKSGRNREKSEKWKKIVEKQRFFFIDHYYSWPLISQLTNNTTNTNMSAIPANANVTILSKNEKKAREIITKLGLTKVKGIVRVAFRKRNNEIIAIEQPDVYKTIGGNYVVFGEPKKDDFTQRLAAAQEGLQQTEISGEGDVDKSPEAIQADMQAAADAIEGSAAPAATEGDDEDEDAGDLSNDDIELVMQQANVTRGKAIKALKLHDADIVNAIMSLSK